MFIMALASWLANVRDIPYIYMYTVGFAGCQFAVAARSIA